MMLGDNSKINPFMMSLLSDNKQKMDPLTLMMLSNPTQTKNMSPMLPLFLSGNTAKDPLMTMLLMAQQANPEINESESTVNLMQMLQMMSNSCDFGEVSYNLTNYQLILIDEKLHRLQLITNFLTLHVKKPLKKRARMPVQSQTTRYADDAVPHSRDGESRAASRSFPFHVHDVGPSSWLFGNPP